MTSPITLPIKSITSDSQEEMSSVFGQLELAGFKPESMGLCKEGALLTRAVRALASAIPMLQVTMHKLGLTQEAMNKILKSYPADLEEVAEQLISSTNKLKDIQDVHKLTPSGLQKQLKFSGTELKTFVDCWHANLSSLRMLQDVAFSESGEAINALFSNLRGQSKIDKLEAVLENFDRIIRVSEATRERVDRPDNFNYFTPIELGRALAGSTPKFLNELAQFEENYGLTS